MATKKATASHPSYHEMIGEAITALKERTGSSQFAIAKYIEEKHKGLPENFKKMLSVQLKRLAASGKLTKVKASFKLAKPISTEKKKKATKSKGASVKKAKTAVKKDAPAKAKAAPAKKKAAPSKVKATPAKKKVSAVVKPKVKKMGKSPAKKAATAKKAKK